MIVCPEGVVQMVTPSNGTNYDLKELQKIVEGNIEIVRLDKDTVMVVNEEGKFASEPQVNSVATMIARAHIAIYPNDCIVGRVLICKSEEVK